MNTKNHNIELNDTSASEMARFRQIMLNIWRQQIEDDRNAEEVNQLIKMIEIKKSHIEPLTLDKKNIDTFFDRLLYINGHFYNEDGTFEGKINELENEGSVENVYICSGKSTQKDKNGEYFLSYNNIESLNIKNEVFLRIAGLAYSESGFSTDVIKRIPFIIMNHHKQLIESEVKVYKKDWSLNNTLIKMRNKWDDKTYAHKFHYGAQGNPAFRNFLNIKLGEAIDFNKNELGRNENSKMKIAIEYTIKAVKYFNNGNLGIDYSDKAIGWQGADINNNENWKKWLFIHSDHKKYAFTNWTNSTTLEESTFESISVFKGSFGTTIFYKSTAFSFKKSKTGNL
ncbi:hypothetical protein [Flavobacterium ginsengiterrae]|uniref:Uncharacterized protein n=1 Tax=Flavobacterium ginsengiterrae TaxID=871695 RepID=A0ABP7GYH1_9FLAO